MLVLYICTFFSLIPVLSWYMTEVQRLAQSCCANSLSSSCGINRILTSVISSVAEPVLF